VLPAAEDVVKLSSMRNTVPTLVISGGRLVLIQDEDVESLTVKCRGGE
jgi:hypothetical protein